MASQLRGSAFRQGRAVLRASRIAQLQPRCLAFLLRDLGNVVHQGVSGGNQGDPGVSGADQGPIRGLRFSGGTLHGLVGAGARPGGVSAWTGPFFSRGSWLNRELAKFQPAVALQARLRVAELIETETRHCSIGTCKGILARRNGVGTFGDCCAGEAFRRCSEEGCVAARAQCQAESKARPGEDLKLQLLWEGGMVVEDSVPSGQDLGQNLLKAWQVSRNGRGCQWRSGKVRWIEFGT